MLGSFLNDLWLAFPAGLMLARCVIMTAAFTGHELAHGLVATAFGDPTPRERGRLTLNPLRHLESVGAILSVLVGFGWSRPTPIRPYRMRRPGWLGGLMAALAGPAASLLMAMAGAAALRMQGLLPAYPWHNLPTLAEWLTVWANFNLTIAVVNLLPLFPLDGFHVIHNVLPLRPSAWWEQASGWTTLVFGLGVFAFLWLPTPLLIGWVGPPMGWLRQVFFGW